jgi:hypothetical protein
MIGKTDCGFAAELVGVGDDDCEWSFETTQGLSFFDFP